MACDPETVRLQREWFRMKLAAEKQKAEVVRKTKEGKGDFILLDVRPAAAYAQGHITGALSLPLEEIAARAATLSKDKEYVTYCWTGT